MMCNRRFGLIVAVAFLSASVTGAAPIVMIQDENASASFDLGQDAGMYNWGVGAAEHMSQQWFWYRLDSDANERPIEALGNEFHGVSDTDFDGDSETMYVRYQDPSLEVEISFVLTGSEPSNFISQLSESIRLTNKSASPLTLHFFQYCDLNLGGTAADEAVWIDGNNTVRQTDVGFSASETVVTPMPTRYQVGEGSGILDSLNDGSITTLDNAAGPIGPGDLVWAFQWDVVLGPAGSPTSTLLIGKNKQIVPEPGMMGLVAIGGLLLFGVRRRRRARTA